MLVQGASGASSLDLGPSKRLNLGAAGERELWDAMLRGGVVLSCLVVGGKGKGNLNICAQGGPNVSPVREICH